MDLKLENVINVYIFEKDEGKKCKFSAES